MAWQRVRINVPESLSPDLRKELGDLMVDKMIENAEEGIGVRKSDSGIRRRRFPGYTRDYIDFKGQSNVDLTLSGDMLQDLKVISHKKGSILIGFDNGSQSNAKAEGNILGSYGRKPNRSKARDFLGLTAADLKELIRQVR